jgi:hypothetical protein
VRLRRSYGAASYLILRAGGNIMVDRRVCASALQQHALRVHASRLTWRPVVRGVVRAARASRRRW